MHQRHLHGIRVFEHGHYEFGLLELVGRDALALILTAHMEKAQPPAPQRGTAALCAVHFYVLAAGYIIERHRLSQRCRLAATLAPISSIAVAKSGARLFEHRGK